MAVFWEDLNASPCNFHHCLCRFVVFRFYRWITRLSTSAAGTAWLWGLKSGNVYPTARGQTWRSTAAVVSTRVFICIRVWGCEGCNGFLSVSALTKRHKLQHICRDRTHENIPCLKVNRKSAIFVWNRHFGLIHKQDTTRNWVDMKKSQGAMSEIRPKMKHLTPSKLTQECFVESKKIKSPWHQFYWKKLKKPGSKTSLKVVKKKTVFRLVM